MRISDWSSDVCSSDLSSLFRFEEHDLFIPMVVLEELDAAKKGTSEIARNARQVSRFLDELMRDKNHAQIEKGLALPGTRTNGNGNGHSHGKRSEEHTSELQSLMRISYAVFCLKKKTSRSTLRHSML